MAARGGRAGERSSVVKHDDWRSAAPFFEVVAAKLQGPSPGPETLAWPPNYHYGGSPFRARGPLPGTKLLGRGPARSPLYLLLLLLLLPHRSSLVLPPVRASPRPRSIDPQISSSPSTGFLHDPRRAFINIFVRAPPWKRFRSRDIRELDETRIRQDAADCLVSAADRAWNRALSRSVRPLVGAKRIIPALLLKVSSKKLSIPSRSYI